MAKKDIFNQYKFEAGLEITDASGDAEAEGEEIDTQGYLGLTFILTLEGTGTSDHTLTLEERDDTDDSWEAVDDDFVLGEVANVEEDGVYKLGYIGDNRYVRCKLDYNGDTNDEAVVTAMLGNARHQPTD